MALERRYLAPLPLPAGAVRPHRARLRISYREALAEQMTAHGLLLFQGASCNHQVPAKLYEYLRARRPILALADPEGDTARAIEEAGLRTCVPLADSDAIEHAVDAFLAAIEAGTVTLPRADVTAGYSRAAGARQLARILDSVTA